MHYSDDFVIVNTTKSKATGTNDVEGVFVALIDPFDAMVKQRVISNNDNDPLDLVYDNVNSYVKELTGTYSGSSISEDIIEFFPTIEYTNNGADVDPYRMGHIGVVVCKREVDGDNDNKLKVSFIEYFIGSLTKTDVDPSNGQSVYIGDKINSTSKYVRFYQTVPTAVKTLPTGTAWFVDSKEIELTDFTTVESRKVIVGSSMANMLDTAFAKVSNILEYEIDLVADAGLSTISQFATSGEFDPVNDAGSNSDILFKCYS
jgi:hypothetical protein